MKRHGTLFALVTGTLIAGVSEELLAQGPPPATPGGGITSNAMPPGSEFDKADKNGKEENGNGDKVSAPKKPPKALLDWAILGEEENGNGDEDEEEDTIQTDRPDFTEASTTVGRGRIQLESGYTFFRDKQNGTTVRTHSYPEALFRIGMFAEWFEWRIQQSFASEFTTENGTKTQDSGATDLYLGVKVALTEQKKYLPETALILQMTVPTGAEAFSNDQVLPGFNYLFGWDIIKDCISFGGSFQMNRATGIVNLSFPQTDVSAVDPGPETKRSFLKVAQSFTFGYTLTKRLGAYTEWFAIYPHSSEDPDVGPEQYFDGGFTYLITNNIQFDIRGGVGLNNHADDMFVGTGLSVRY